MKKLIAIMGAVMFASSLAACNTFAGIGKDVERGGEKVQDAATNNK